MLPPRKPLVAPIRPQPPAPPPPPPQRIFRCRVCPRESQSAYPPIGWFALAQQRETHTERRGWMCSIECLFEFCVWLENDARYDREHPRP